MEATVAAYLDMLLLELSHRPFNKTERRRALQRLLSDRTEGAIERKHQNISAILIERGYPYVDGYKPLADYQALLAEVVEDRVASMPALAAALVAEVTRPATPPSFDDILGVLVEAPVSEPHRYRKPPKIRDTARAHWRDRTTRGAPPNYLELEAANNFLGRAGEQFVLDYERARLIAAGFEALAAKVEDIASTRHGAGFDILSYENDGRERLIEVKTTTFGRFTPFFVSRNELDVSIESPAQYHLYRLFSFRSDARLFIRNGPLNQRFSLDPSLYTAKIV